MFSKLFSGSIVGIDGIIVSVEIDILNKSLPSISVVGLADIAVKEAKERVFSARDEKSEWDASTQPPELWNQYKTDFAPGTHVRIHPLLEWTELNIWEYIEQENIPIIPLYFDNGQGKRYRSLGCYPCTSPVDSTAKNTTEIITELPSGKFKALRTADGKAK